MLVAVVLLTYTNCVVWHTKIDRKKKDCNQNIVNLQYEQN